MRRAVGKVIGIVVAGWLLGACLNAAVAAGPSVIAWQELEAAWKSMRTEQRPLVLFVTTDGCLFCNKMKAQTYADAAVVRQIRKSFVAASVNGSRRPQVARKLGVRVYPTTVIISPENKVVETINGYMAADAFRARLEAASRRVDTARRPMKK